MTIFAKVAFSPDGGTLALVRVDACAMMLRASPRGLSMNAEERVLARIADREIRFSEIACDRAWAERHPRWLSGRTADEACLAEERRAFSAIVTAELLERAYAGEGWSLSSDEVERVRAAIAPDEMTMRRGQTEARRLPEAVRRVYLGESFQAFYDDAVRPLGHSVIIRHREVPDALLEERLSRRVPG